MIRGVFLSVTLSLLVTPTCNGREFSASLHDKGVDSLKGPGKSIKATAEITTNSPEALRYYLEGVNQLEKNYPASAEALLKKAVSIDSTFAMAYLKLAAAAPTVSTTQAYFQKALQYSVRASPQERERIKAYEGLFFYWDLWPVETIRRLQEFLTHYPDDVEARLTLGFAYRENKEFQKSIDECKLVVELDPLNKLAYEHLTVDYGMLGDFAKSLNAIDQVISMTPGEPDPYDLRGDCYSMYGKLNEAIASYEIALSLKPDFQSSLGKLGQMYTYEKAFARADSFYRILKASPDSTIRFMGELGGVDLLIYQGRFKSALSESKRLDGHGDIILQDLLRYRRQMIFWMMKDLPSAAEEAGEIVEFGRKNNLDAPVYQRNWYIAILAEKGDLQKAESVASELKKDMQGDDSTKPLDSYWWAMGWIKRAKGNSSAALIAFQKSASGNRLHRRHYMVGRGYLEANVLEEAVSKFEELEHDYSSEDWWDLDGQRRSRTTFWGVQIYYYLGIAYEKSGQSKKAIGQYEEFLDILKNADRGISEVDDAKARLAKLKKKG